MRRLRHTAGASSPLAACAASPSAFRDYVPRVLRRVLGRAAGLRRDEQRLVQRSHRRLPRGRPSGARPGHRHQAHRWRRGRDCSLLDARRGRRARTTDRCTIRRPTPRPRAGSPSSHLDSDVVLGSLLEALGVGGEVEVARAPSSPHCRAIAAMASVRWRRSVLAPSSAGAHRSRRPCRSASSASARRCSTGSGTPANRRRSRTCRFVPFATIVVVLSCCSPTTRTSAWSAARSTRLHRDCRSVLRSPENGSPQRFEDREWLASSIHDRWPQRLGAGARRVPGQSAPGALSPGVLFSVLVQRRHARALTDGGPLLLSSAGARAARGGALASI